MAELRWPTVDGPGPERDQGALFDADELAGHHVGSGEFRGMEFLHVRARTIINRIPAAAQLPFSHTVNVYRGCSHACSYCLAGDTRILMGDGRTKAIAHIRAGDTVYGTEQRGAYRRLALTEVRDQWSTRKPAYRIRLADGTELVASGDHRFLTQRGWKHVTGTTSGRDRRPHLTLNDRLQGLGGGGVEPVKVEVEYQRGYLCGMVRGDANLACYPDRRRKASYMYRFRLALADAEALDRSEAYLDSFGVETARFEFSPATEERRAMHALRKSTAAAHHRIHELIAWPTEPPMNWWRGFLAGVFDAEGSCSKGVLRISNNDADILAHVTSGLAALGFQSRLEPARPNGVRCVRLLGGAGQRRRFFDTVAPAISRKLSVDGDAIKTKADLRVVAIEDLGFEMRMYDISTGTGDFIANGVISHNCFARPTHDYLGLGIGEDFERKIVVKINAVELLRAELAARRWPGHHIAMGTNTDPYQRCEGKYHLTRGVIGVLAERANPFSILTKSTLILRDLDLLVDAAQRTDVRVNLSIGTLDEEVWKLTEPGTPAPRLRVEAVRKLRRAGLDCGVLVAPVLPGLSDRPEQLAEVIDACVEAGAASISAVPLHLRPSVRDHYLGWLERARPDLLDEHEQRYVKSYLPQPERQALATTVRRLVDESTSRHRPPAPESAWASARDIRLVEGGFTRRLRDQMGGDAAPCPAPAEDPPEQLGLL